MPLSKKGDPTNIDNYRCTSLLSLPGKVFAIVLENILQKWADGLLMEGQCGFRKGRSCNDEMFSLKGLCELIGRTGNDLHTCFIDLSKAYDSVDMPLAWELFSSLGFGTFSAVWDFLQRCYSSSKTCMTTLCVRCKQTRADKAVVPDFHRVQARRCECVFVFQCVPGQHLQIH